MKVCAKGSQTGDLLDMQKTTALHAAFPAARLCKCSGGALRGLVGPQRNCCQARRPPLTHLVKRCAPAGLAAAALGPALAQLQAAAAVRSRGVHLAHEQCRAGGGMHQRKDKGPVKPAGGRGQRRLQASPSLFFLLADRPRPGCLAEKGCPQALPGARGRLPLSRSRRTNSPVWVPATGKACCPQHS